MKMITSLDEIPELNKPNVHIKNRDELLRKINKIVTDGHKKLQIVTDFDHTLTRQNMDNGIPVLTSFGMFRECPSIPQHYKDEELRLAAIYKPIEVDPALSLAEKTKHMVDWYLAANRLLRGVKFPRNELLEVGQKMKECFRSGARELIARSSRERVPLLVFSAGLGDAVRAALAAAGCLLPNVKVISNFLAMDENDVIFGIEGDVIHTYNKNEAAIKNTEYYETVKERPNVLLMGDNVGDARMADGMEHCAVVVKLGFLARDTEPDRRLYGDVFDVVLLHEDSVELPTALLRLALRS